MTKPAVEQDQIQPLGSPGPEPILIEVRRGDIVESRHAVDAAVVDTAGTVVAAWGEIGRPVYPRSATKPIQALPLVESGAADAFGLEHREIALACASHAGEQVHVETVLAWLKRLGLAEDDLECGAHWPRDPVIFEDLIRADTVLGPARNNCSGKHTGMLSHAVHLGDPTADYIGPEHPVQVRVAAALGALTDVDLAGAPRGVDGCSIPTYPIPLRNLALAMARFASPGDLAPERAMACRRIAGAMWAEPYMVAGRARCCTAILEACRERVVAKTGAEGVYMAGLSERGLGIALKARDGAGRAAEVAMVALLDETESLDEAARAALAPFGQPEVRSVRGATVGGLGTAAFRPWAAF
ncbi:MAG: asparaginase [Alphaproteobacteria bacterium]|jgi:L-asparaginase II|nr:asparaginase [Alphaproteobacteria bacterium]